MHFDEFLSALRSIYSQLQNTYPLVMAIMSASNRRAEDENDEGKDSRDIGKKIIIGVVAQTLVSVIGVAVGSYVAINIVKNDMLHHAAAISRVERHLERLDEDVQRHKERAHTYHQQNRQ